MPMSNYLEVALEAARASQEIIMRYYAGAVSPRLKNDQTPVTVADTEAEKKIEELIGKAFPSHGFLGEESGEKNEQSGFKWIIDPIDGTKNYVRGIPLFATQIALMRDEELILGVSNAPALRELLYAEKNKGAYCNDVKITVSKVESLAEAFMSFGNLKYFEDLRLIPQLIGLVQKARNPRGVGDAWSYHLLAQGKIDMMADARTKIWDIAALKVIVEEAGGHVTDFRGNPITTTSNSVIATNSLLHDLIISYFNIRNKEEL